MQSLTQSYTKPFLAVLLLLFVASLTVPKGEDVLLINGAHTPALDEFFKALTIFGDGLWIVPLVIVSLFIRFRYALAIVLSAVLNGVVISILKRALFHGLARPKMFLDNALLHFVHGVDVHSINSFPSGHTATAFGLALCVALMSGRKTLAIFTLLLALAVGYSRIYLAQHFLIDVTAGAITGCFTAIMAWEIVQSIRMPGWVDGKFSSINR